MALGTELATAYVSIMPSTSGLGKGIAKEFGKVEGEADATGKRSGNRFSQAFNKWAGRAVKVGAVAVGAAAGAAVVSGFRSAVDQQEGQKVLSGLYGDAEKAASTLEGLKKMSKGSPINYGAYQDAAGSLAYAGVEGDNAIGVLENVGKAITSAGGDSSNMDRATDAILKGVNAGKFQLDTLQQLSDAGVPILSGLAEHFGVPMEQVNKMASEGKVGLEDVIAVMEQGTGETFQKMISAGESATESFGNQWKIVKDNVQVALGQTMLPLIEKLTPLIGPVGDAVVGAIEKIPDFAEKLKKPLGDVIGFFKEWWPLLAVITGGILAYAAAVKVALIIKTLTKAIKAAAAMQWTLNAAMAANPIGVVVAIITLLAAAFVVAYMKSETFRNIVQGAWAGIKIAAAAVWGWIKGTLWPGILAAWDAIAAGAVWLYENALKPAWNGIKIAIDAVWSWIRDTLWPGIKGVWDAIAGAAMWLWQSVLQPAWNGIKLAIAIAVTAILVYGDMLVAIWRNVVAPAAMWLWNNVMKPVWNGIKAAIGAVVSWFQNTAWPLLSKVIDWIRTKFEQFKTGLGIIWAFIKNRVINPVIAWFKGTVWPIVSRVIDWLRDKFENFKRNLGIIWDFIKNRVINPVVAWFRDTAWPMIKRVIDKLKAGFQSMRDRLKTIWDNVKNRVVAPVANWFRDTLQPRIESVTDNIKSAFDTMKDGVKAAWDGIKSAARVPAKFVIEDVYNDSIRATFNGVASKLGLKTRLPEGKVGFASGGVMPGYTPGRDVHQFYSPTAGRLDLSGGEAIMRPEFTRAVGGPAGVAALNMKARKGQAFAGGGVWGKIKGIGGDAWDWMKDKASTVAEALGDPLGVITKLASKAMDLVPGGGMIRDLVKKAGTNAAKWGGEWLKDQLFNSEVGTGSVPQAGAGSGGWGKASSLASAFGLRMTSGSRPGARTAGSGSVSMHALGRARDYAGSASAMRQFFNGMDSAPYPTELLYSPMGGRNIHRGGGRYPNTGATLRNHYNHVHVAFKNGGVFDNGGMMEPGAAGINLTRKPEAVLDPRATRAYMAHGESLAKNDGKVDLSDSTLDRLADKLAERPNVLQIGNRQAGQLAMAGANARRTFGG